MNIIEINYDAGRKMDSFNYRDLFNDSFYTIYAQIPQSEFFTSFVVFSNLAQRARMINNIFKELLQIHQICQSGGGENGPGIHAPFGGLEFELGYYAQYKLKVEELVFHMKIIVDLLVQVSYIARHNNTIIIERKIDVDSIGALRNKVVKGNQMAIDVNDLIHGNNSTYLVDNTRFLDLINTLFNSFKHCFIHGEAHKEFGFQYPTVLSYYAPLNNFNNNIEYHNHNLYHIMMGFQDNIIRIHHNLELYLNGAQN